MVKDNELLLAISDMMDKKLEPVTGAIEVMQNDLGKLQTNVEILQTDVGNLQTNVEKLQTNVENLQTKVENIQTNVENLQTNVEGLQMDMHDVKEKVTSIELKLENETNHNIQLLAENHINLIDKLNQAIRASDKTLLNEVQVSLLKSKVEHLEKEIAEIKNQSA